MSESLADQISKKKKKKNQGFVKQSGQNLLQNEDEWLCCTEFSYLEKRLNTSVKPQGVLLQSVFLWIYFDAYEQKYS